MSYSVQIKLNGAYRTEHTRLSLPEAEHIVSLCKANHLLSRIKEIKETVTVEPIEFDVPSAFHFYVWAEKGCEENTITKTACCITREGAQNEGARLLTEIDEREVI